jgi:hypothetical protein
MSKELDDQGYTFQCNECGETLSTAIADEEEARQLMFDEGWVEELITVIGNPQPIMHHYCPDCQEEDDDE